MNQFYIGSGRGQLPSLGDVVSNNCGLLNRFGMVSGCYQEPCYEASLLLSETLCEPFGLRMGPCLAFAL